MTTTTMPRPDVVAAPWDGGALLLDLDERRLHELNPTAAAVWEVLREHGSGRVVDVLSRHYDVAPHRLRADVDGVLAEFARAGLTMTETTREPLRVPVVADPVDGAGLGPFLAGRCPFTVRCADSATAAELTRVLRSLRWPRELTQTVSQLSVDPGERRGVAVERLVAAANELAVTGAPECVAFHAGAVTIGGRAVLLPAPSNRGKSTLTASLVRAGAGYLSDEVALLEPTRGTILPYPKAIALDPGSFPLFDELRPPDRAGFESHRLQKWYVDPRRVGAIESGSAPVAAVVAPTHVPGRPSTLEAVDGRRAVDLLLANSFDFAPAGEAGFAALVELARSVPVYELTVGELDAATALVMEST